ncbi:MAG: hypothetical protein Q9160_009061 [Pyrenula sp. 1 TL-2023]
MIQEARVKMQAFKQQQEEEEAHKANQKLQKQHEKEAYKLEANHKRNNRAEHAGVTRLLKLA